MITIQENTTKNPIQLIGYESGVCWGGDTSDPEKNKKRGLDCLSSNHGRTFEYPQIYMTIEGYSARCVREFYTHIAGGPTRLQASTRYIDYTKKGFDFVIPPSVEKSESAKETYLELMNDILTAGEKLELFGVPKEDVANILPLGMLTKVVVRFNVRNLIDFCSVRLCSRAYWEIQKMAREILKALSNYSEEWKELVESECKAKCEKCGFCNEKNSCGRRPKKEVVDQVIEAWFEDNKNSN